MSWPREPESGCPLEPESSPQGEGRTIEDCKDKFPANLGTTVQDRYRDALNELARVAHLNSKTKGFWDGIDPSDLPVLGMKCALIHSEVSELLEAYRKNPYADCGKKFPDAYAGAEEDLKFSGGKFYGDPGKVIPGGPIGLNLEEEELADIIIRVLDLSAHRGIDLGRAVLRKMEYNATRPHKHGKNC